MFVSTLKLRLLLILMALVVVSRVTAVHAESFETVLSSIFKTADGHPTLPKNLPITNLTHEPQGYLILFWAGWCVPCKEELALVAAQPDQLKNWRVIAMNVDDAGGRVRADGILKSMNWPHASLFDEAGAVFFQINASGDLPLALSFDPDGHLLEVIRDLKAPTLARLSQQRFQTRAQGGWEVRDDLHYVQRNRYPGTSEAEANSLGVQYSNDEWQVGATHNLIRQKRDPHLAWTRFEDEIGPSYLQWQHSGAQGLTRLRLGDDTVEWGKGALLSARALPGTDTNASLLGAHWSQSYGPYSLTLAGGRVRQQLFGLVLDPTVDLTQNLPTETVYGGVVGRTFKLGENLNSRLAVGTAHYRREDRASLSTSYLSPYEDHRVHGSLGLSHELWGLEYTQTHYTIDRSQTPALKKSDSAQVDGYLRNSESAQLQLGATYLEKHDSIPRTFTPVLTEYPAIPITIDDLRTWRLAPRATVGKWVFEPQWIAEQSIHADDFEKQNTYVISALRPEREFKAIVLHQRHGSNPLRLDADQDAAVLGSALTDSLSGLVEYKSYVVKGRAHQTALDQKGQSVAAQLALKIEKALDLKTIGQLQLAITRTHQSGYFLSTSGIDRRELTSFRLTWLTNSFELRLAACREPGGIVCSGGICAQRPPLDGFQADGSVHWNF